MIRREYVHSELTQKEKRRQVLRDALLGRGGAEPGGRQVVSPIEYPKGANWCVDPVPSEPPIGSAVGQLEARRRISPSPARPSAAKSLRLLEIERQAAGSELAEVKRALANGREELRKITDEIQLRRNELDRFIKRTSAIGRKLFGT
jgi:hypothetical protein